jgi:transcriptional regulator with XRE-family HTH domain
MERDEKQTYIAIGKRIQLARDAEHITQEMLAKALGYQSATAISLIESGERKVKISDLEKIAGILHEDIHYLLTGERKQPMQNLNVRTALRASDNDLKKDELDKIESFIAFVKSQRNGQ